MSSNQQSASCSLHKSFHLNKVVSMNSFPLISKIVARVLSQFGSSWLNESGFSTMKIIKSKYRSALSEKNLDSCMRVSLYDGEIFLDEVMKFRKSKKRDESTLKSNETEVSQHQDNSSSDEDDDDDDDEKNDI